MLQVVVLNTEKENSGWNMPKTIDYSECHHYITIIRKRFHESKIVNRMIIIGVMLAIVCLITLKMR
jgi:phospho-N-acetylmuramoyl-pentapeptide-transferase